MAHTFTDAAECWKELLTNPSADRKLLTAIERFARENTQPAQIVFGTSGWRGEIGSDYTFNNVRIVASAIIEMFKRSGEPVMRALGVRDFDEARKRGIIVGHDNRLLGPEFAMEVLGYLQKEGIRTWYAGQAATPEFSAGIEMLHAACSINLTPSHNPANYSGFKFNPADGGPAGSEITSRIEEIANGMMREATTLPSIKAGPIEKVDLTSLYLSFITGRKTLDIDKIHDFINRVDCTICIDNVHGATRGRMEKILGFSSKIIYLRTADNVLFGGIAPEPSEKNMEGVERVLSECGTYFKLGVIMDPDGDRIRYSDGSMQIPMNYFGAMALHFLHIYKGLRGVAAKSVGTSNFVNAIAEKYGIPVRETKVGFKNFRPYLLPDARERAIIAFEESDGISGYNNT
ncbi:MAG TPA: phosphomannomutase, partial [Dissulfurispiraceae bacterium]|nr:phosphomannomutase [Dissulfurispiraceae bacterium]